MQNVQLNAPDISHLETRFREMLCEIQRNSENVEKLEQEQLKSREELYSKESHLQDERRTSNELRSRLKSVIDNISRLEEEKMQDRIERSNLTIAYESALRERQVLVEEATSGRAEAAKFKLKAESLENALRRETRRRKELENGLTEMKDDHEKIIAQIDLSISKIVREQKCLLETCRSVIGMNKRLQTLCNCFHEIDQKNRTELKDLQCKLIACRVNSPQSLPSNEKLHPEIENLCIKLKEMVLELKSKLESSTTVEESLNKILELLSLEQNSN